MVKKIISHLSDCSWTICDSDWILAQAVYGRHILANYIPVLIWIIGAVVCAYIARKRGVRITALRSFIVALLGPIAIPLAFIIKAGITAPVEKQR